MLTKSKPALAVTAADVMSRAVITVPLEMPLREAARLLWRAGVSAAPVVNDRGRCVGMLSAVDLLRWAEDGPPAPRATPLPCCRYQVKGQLLTGEDAVICNLLPGMCPLQSVQPTTAGPATPVCLQPNGVLCDWQQVEASPEGTVSGHMTSDVVTASPQTPLSELARTMTGGRIHRIPVVDERGRPVGIVSTTDVLAAVARDWLCSAHGPARPDAPGN